MATKYSRVSSPWNIEKRITRLRCRASDPHQGERGSPLVDDVSNDDPDLVAGEQIDWPRAADAFHAMVGDDDEHDAIPVGLHGSNDLTDQRVGRRVRRQRPRMIRSEGVAPRIALIEMGKEKRKRVIGNCIEQRSAQFLV